MKIGVTRLIYDMYKYYLVEWYLLEKTGGDALFTYFNYYTTVISRALGVGITNLCELFFLSYKCI